MNQAGYFSNGRYKLSYVCTLPDNPDSSIGVIFVHAANANRLGPHRMFVELAEIFRISGVVSFRFDMSGCGDSQGRFNEKDLAAEIEDLAAAIEFFRKKYGMDKIVLLGISRGAKVCHALLEQTKVRVAAAILLSAPYSSNKLAVKSFLGRLKEYLYKFKDADSRKKLLTGKANISQINKTFAFALSSFKRYRTNSTATSFATKCPMYFIYGGKDPITNDSIKHYSTVCEKHKIPFQITTIENANHSFFNYKWKEQIFEMIQDWIKKT